MSITVANSVSDGSVGSSGEGGSTSGAPCADACANDPGCFSVPAKPEDGGACASCVQAEADEGVGSECAVEGILGDCCQSEVDCADYVNCVLSGDATCDRDYPDGAERARECILYTCGNCGNPS